MYEAYFGLHRRPFAATPDPDCFLQLGDVGSVLAEVTHCVEEGRGIAVVTAPAGVGKTLLCRRLGQDLQDRWAIASLPTATFPTRRALLQAILFELGHQYARSSENELRLKLAACGRQLRPGKRAVLVLLDEAHLLNERLLEELRGLTNHLDDGHPLFQVVLCGQLALDDLLASPGLEAFRQRIGCQATLQTLTHADSAAYLAQRLEWAGGSIEAAFTGDAVRLIAHASDGLPRCLNQLADHALLLGYVAEQKPVSEETVRQALEDLRQLPLHWNEPSRIPTPLEQLQSQHPHAEIEPSGVAPSAGEYEGDGIKFTAAEFGAEEPDSPPIVEEKPASRRTTVPAKGTIAESPEGEFAAIEIGGGDASPAFADGGDSNRIPSSATRGEPNPPRREVPKSALPAEEAISDPWSSTVAGRDVFETVLETLNDIHRRLPKDPPQQHPAPRVGNPAPAPSPRPAPATPSNNPASTQPAMPVLSHGDDWASADMTSAVRPSISFEAAASSLKAKAEPARPHFQPPSPKPKPRRKSARDPRGPISFVEEVVVDRYALLDAGKPAPEARDSVPPEPASWDFGRTAPLSPDALIDRIVPMIDAALATDGGPAPTSSAPAEVQRSLRRETARSRVGGVYSLVTSDDGDDLEEEIGAAVLEQCLDTQREIVSRLGQADRDQFDAHLKAMSDAELLGGIDTADFPSPGSSSSGLTSGPNDPLPPNPPDRPLSDATPRRQYSQLFSALRKKFRRPA